MLVKVLTILMHHQPNGLDNMRNTLSVSKNIVSYVDIHVKSKIQDTQTDGVHLVMSVLLIVENHKNHLKTVFWKLVINEMMS